MIITDVPRGRLDTWLSRWNACQSTRRTWPWALELCKILGIVVRACNSRVGEVETGGSEGMQASQPRQNSECQFSERPVCTEGVHEERHHKLTSGLTHICVCWHIHACTSTDPWTYMQTRSHVAFPFDLALIYWHLCVWLPCFFHLLIWVQPLKISGG